MYKVDRYKLASMLLTFFSMTVVVTAIFLLAGISVSIWNILFASTVTASIFLYKDNDFKKTIFHLVVVAAIIVLITLFSSSVFDQTWDGAAYHKQAIGFLKYGWNPVYQANTVFNELSHNIRYPMPNPMLWAEAYPKATWYFSASIYAITGNIESGKMYHLLFALITYLFFSEFLIRKGFKKYQVILVSLVVSLNPIMLAQFCSYYLDSLVAVILMLIMLFFSQIIEGEQDNKKTWLNLYFLMAIGCNLKFSVGVFIAVVSVIFLFFYGYRKRKDIKLFVSRFSVFVGAACTAVFVVGVAPFLTNLLRFHNMFYGFLGETALVSKENMENLFGILGLNNPMMFFLSLMGRMGHGNYPTIAELLKIPFTFEMQELGYYYYVDPRLGGFGVFFSGIFLVSVVCIILLRKKWIQQFPEKKDFLNLLVVFSIALMIVAAILPATYNARYVGFLYIIVYIAMYMLFSFVNEKKGEIRILKYLGIFLCAISLMNVAPFFKVTQSRIDRDVNTKSSLQYLRDISYEGKKIYIAFYAYDFSGMHYNLMDNMVHYEFVPIEEIDNTYTATYSNWMFYKIEETEEKGQ